MQAAEVIRAVPTLLNISRETLTRRLKLLREGLRAWGTAAAALPPSVLGRLLTARDERLMRLLYVSFLHGGHRPSHGASPGTGPTPVSSEAGDSTNASHGPRARSLSRSVPAGDSSLAPVSSRRAAQAGMHARSLREGELACLKAPLTLVAMSDEDFYAAHPRFSRWLRRKKRSLSVNSSRL
jgi:hypothetical protein